MEKTYSNNNIEEIYNLMPLQEGMLFSNELNEESYINQRILLFNRKPNKKFIEETLELLSLKHEVLRTSFARMDNSYQVVYKNRKIEFSVFEYNNETEYNSIIRSQEKRPFDLEKDVLIRFSLLKGFDTEYKLMIISHHIILDGWSVDILLNDFIYIYEQLENGNEYDELYDTILFEKEDMVSYGDFVSYVNSIDHDNAKNYWKELLSDFENETILPETGSNSNSNQNGVFELIIEANLINSIYRYNKDNNVSVSTVFESAFGILLHKYLSMDDVVFGKIVSGRNVTDFSAEKIVGLLINTVPIRVKSEKDTKICDVVNSINNQNINSMSYSYEQLSEISSFTILRSKLVNILFAFENFAGSGDENDKERLLSNTGGFSNEIKLEYPLVVSVYPGKNFIIRYSFDLSKYDCDYIKSFAESYIKILNEICKDKDCTVGIIDVISDNDRRKILNEFNATETEYPREKTVAELFEEQVEKTPDKTALVFGEEKLTYKELNARANSLAHKLRELGVKPDDFVAVIADRSIEMIAGIYGIIKAGGAYVPIDPTYPEDRINFMIEDCKPKAVLKYTTEEVAFSTEIPVIDLGNESIWNGNTQNPEHVNKSEDLIYCIYTSGTTGRPKGVLIENHGIIAMQDYLVKLYDVAQKDNVLQFANYIFDASVWEMTLALYCGATLVLISSDKITDTVAFEKYMKENNVTLTLLPPQYFRQTNVDTFRILTTGGSASDSNVVSHVKENCRYINAYGPTENTVLATHWEYDKNKEIPLNIPIGKPISNSRIYILNGDNLCGIGVPGELCIAGDGLARGYLNRPELTEEKFVKNPYGEGRMYRSGDLARWLPDGNIEYLGRIDEQVKIRGFRIELGEIENRIREIEDIRDCAVIARADSAGDKAIYAYYTSAKEVNVSDIRDRLSESMPEYMVPAYMMQIESIPVTRNGKLDKRSLPDIETKNTREYVAPGNEEEEAVCRAFSEILNVKQVGVHDSFFELGGDSIKAIRIISKLRNSGYTTTVKDIMNGKTAEKIAKSIRKSSEEQRYEQGEISGKIESTPIIKEFGEWSLAKPEHFNQSMMFPVRGIENTVIRKAIEEIVKHHDILRAVYRKGILEILPVNESMPWK